MWPLALQSAKKRGNKGERVSRFYCTSEKLSITCLGQTELKLTARLSPETLFWLKSDICYTPSSLAMVNTSEDLTARLTRKEKKRRKRQKPQGITDSNQSDARNRTLNQRSSDGGLEENSWEEMEPNRYASRIIRDKGLQEIVSACKRVLY